MKNDIEKRLSAIEVRNARVEQDKTWEISWTRRLSIAVLTYAVVVAYLIVIDNNAPFINAAVPVVGFLFSTLLLRQIRNFWQNRR
ncbi:MAG: hypothetical protein AAB896_03170 [Patescibacteria group bacterium]